MKKLSASAALVIGAWSLVIPLSAAAQAPQLINYQGRLLSGTNLVNGSVGLSLRLFNLPSGGASIYEDSNTVTVADGLYSTFIGDHPTNSAFLSALTNTAVWIEAAVNGVTLSPRERLASVGYSLATRGIAVSASGNIVVHNPSTNSIGPQATHSTIGGGARNSIQGNFGFSFLGGGFENSIQPNSQVSFLGGGQGNEIQSNSTYSVLGGGFVNTIQTGAHYAVIGGGFENRVTGAYGVVPGGYYNSAGEGSFAAGRFAKATNDGSFVWADQSSFADFGTSSSNQFLIRATGGVGIGTTSPETVLHISRGSAGGITASSSALLAVENNTNAFIHLMVPTNAMSGILFGNPDESLKASIRVNHFGGDEMIFRNGDNTTKMTILTNGSVGIGTTVPDARLHVQNGSAGAVTANPASVGVFEGSTNAYVSLLTGDNAERGILFGGPASSADGGIVFNNPGLRRGLQFRVNGNVTEMVIASNGFVGINTASPTNLLQVGVNGAWCNGLAWQDVSDATRKENFAPVDAEEILRRVSELPVLYWNYKEDTAAARHIGPMAQHFHQAFGVGDNNTSLSGVDRSGVALAAIQALAAEDGRQRTENRGQQEKIEALEQTILELRARLDALEKK